MDKKIELLLVILLVFSLLFLLLNLRESWRKINEHEWYVVDNLCTQTCRLSPHPMSCASCYYICYTKSIEDVWKYCKEKGTIKISPDGDEVLCIPGGCRYRIVNNECMIICPI